MTRLRPNVVAAELAECVADGATKEGALRNVETVAAEWIETAEAAGLLVPEPRGRLMFA